MKRSLLLSLVVVVAACGGDATGPKNASVGGTWRFAFTLSGTMSGVAVTCTVGGADFNLTQSGNTFSGVQVGTGTLTCTAPGTQAFNEQIAGETIVNGQINGNAVTFSLGSIPGQHSGSISGTSMSGTAQWNLPGATPIVLGGQFTAAKL